MLWILYNIMKSIVKHEYLIFLTMINKIRQYYQMYDVIQII